MTELIELVWRECATWISRIGSQKFDRHAAGRATAVDLGAFIPNVADQRCQSTSES
jgi:hypothetical protein